MVFCNDEIKLMDIYPCIVTILILIDGFLQSGECIPIAESIPSVTILILIDGFLQFKATEIANEVDFGVTILILIDGFLQYNKC